MSNDFNMPEFLKKQCEPETYKTWLTRKANTHIKRDNKRWEISATREDYKKAIHQAVIESKGMDAYTGKKLKWDLICKYNNDESKEGKSEYKKKFGELPTVDHVSLKGEKLKFKICSWKVNDAKNDLNYKEFVKLCSEIVDFANQKK
jgi:hypothetical protein